MLYAELTVEEAMNMREHRLWDDDDDDFYLLDDPTEQESAHPAHSAWIHSQLWHGCNATFLVSAARPKINAHF
jgi:hypothetical protein